MDSLSEAILHIAQEYENAENKMVGMSEGYADTEDGKKDWRDKFNDIIQKIKDWMVENGLLKPEKQERIDGEKVTEHHSDKTWKNASLEERKEIMDEYIKAVSDIMGIEVEIGTPLTDDDADGYVTRGAYT